MSPREQPEDVIARLIAKGPLDAEDLIEWLRAKGYQDDEILENVEKSGHAVIAGADGRLSWTRGGFGLHERRLVEKRLAEIAQEERALSDEDFRSAILRLHRGGLGEKGIGLKLGWSEATIRRARERFGLIPWPED